MSALSWRHVRQQLLQFGKEEIDSALLHCIIKAHPLTKLLLSFLMEPLGTIRVAVAEGSSCVYTNAVLIEHMLRLECRLFACAGVNACLYMTSPSSVTNSRGSRLFIELCI